MTTYTIGDLRALGPCYDPARYLPEGWQGTLLDILDVEQAPAQDRLWVALRLVRDDRLSRWFACDCAERALARLDDPDPRSVEAVAVARRHARGTATDDERAAAWAAAWDAWPAAGAAAGAAWAAARAAAEAAARAAAGAAGAAAEAAVRAAAGAAWAAAWDAWAAAWAAARAAAGAAGAAAWDAWAAAWAAAGAAACDDEREWQVARLRYLLTHEPEEWT